MFEEMVRPRRAAASAAYGASRPRRDGEGAVEKLAETFIREIANHAPRRHHQPDRLGGLAPASPTSIIARERV